MPRIIGTARLEQQHVFVCMCVEFLGVFRGLCHVNPDEPNRPPRSEIRLPQFHAIQRMLWRGFDEEFGERLDDVAN